MRPELRSPGIEYGVAALSVVLATVVRHLLDPVLGNRFPFATLFFAVLFSAWYGGFGPALAATILGAVASVWLLLPSPDQLRAEGVSLWAGLILYLTVSFGIALLGGTMRTAQQRAERARNAEGVQRERLHVTLKSIGDGVVVTDPQSQVTLLNSVAQALTGWTQEEAYCLALETVFKIVNEQTRLPVENPARRALKEGVIVGLANHTILIAKDGTERHIDDSAAPIQDAHGNVLGVILTFRDVTEKRRAEEQLRRSEQELADFFENATVGLHWVGPDGTILRVNQAELDLLGYSREEYVGRSIAEFHADPDVIEDILCRLTAGETLRHYEARLRCKDGSVRHVIIESSVFREDGKFVHTRCFTRDITEQKRAQEEVRFQAHLLDTVGQAAIVTDPNGTIIYWNRYAETLYGWPRAEVLGRDIREVVVAPEWVEQAAAVMGRLQAGETWSGEFLVRRRAGTTFPAFVTDTPVFDGDGKLKAIIGISTDISERKRTEQALHFLADASATLTSLVDYESTLQKVAALAVPTFADWCAVDMAEAGGSLRRVAVAHGDAAKVELAHELQQRYPPDPDAPHGAYRVLRSGEADLLTEIPDALIVQSARDDDHLRILRQLGLTSSMCVPLRARGKILGVISFVSAESGRHYTESDLTFAEELARRAATALENAQLYEELRQTDRRKDEFLATLAHELRNPMAPIRNGLQVLKLADDPAAREQAREMMERQLGQMVRLVDDLLDISRITSNKLELRKARIELRAVIENAVETARPQIEASGHTLVVDLPPQPVYLAADLTRLAQVFWNLLNNSAKYTDPGGRISLSAELQDGDVVVAVRDTGIGIPASAQPRLFELFSQVDRSLERSQGGLGIGLALVKGLTEMHGGTVKVQSAGAGHGSTFVVRLPVAQGIPDQQQPPPSSGLGDGQKRRILVVDDNRDGAASLAMLLSLAGHDTRTAHDGLEAVELAEAFRPELIVLDIGLPKLNGYDACRRIREQPWGRQMVIVAATGWGQEEDRRRSHESGFDHHMVKPVDPQALMKLLAGLQAAK